MDYATFCRWPLPLVMLVMALFLQIHPCESHSKLEHVLLPSHAYPSGCLLLLGKPTNPPIGGLRFLTRRVDLMEKILFHSMAIAGVWQLPLPCPLVVVLVEVKNNNSLLPLPCPLGTVPVEVKNNNALSLDL